MSLVGNAVLWPFSVPIHLRSHLKKQSRDPDVVGQVQNGKNMRYVNVRVDDNRCLFRKRE